MKSVTHDKVDLGNGWFAVTGQWLNHGYRRRHVTIHGFYPSARRFVIRFRSRPFYPRSR